MASIPWTRLLELAILMKCGGHQVLKLLFNISLSKNVRETHFRLSDILQIFLPFHGDFKKCI